VWYDGRRIDEGGKERDFIGNFWEIENFHLGFG
jgi:hypothetical protein